MDENTIINKEDIIKLIFNDNDLNTKNLKNYFNINIINVDNNSHEIFSLEKDFRINKNNIQLKNFSADIILNKETERHLSNFNIESTTIIINKLFELFNNQLKHDIFEKFYNYKINIIYNRFITYLNSHNKIYNFFVKYLKFLSFQKRYNNYIKNTIIKCINNKILENEYIITSYDILSILLESPYSKTDMTNNIITYKNHNIILPVSILPNTINNTSCIYIIPKDLKIDIFIKYNPNMISTYIEDINYDKKFTLNVEYTININNE